MSLGLSLVHGEQIMKKRGYWTICIGRLGAREKEAKLVGPRIRDRLVLDLDVGPYEKGLKTSKTGLDWA